MSAPSSVPSFKEDGSGSSKPPSSTTSVELDDAPFHNVENEPTVISGMAFRFPGAKSISQLWDNVVSKRDLQTKIPQDRFNVDAFYHPLGTNKGTTNARYGYFLEDSLSEFDNEFFRISKQEAESMDPQQRLLLEVVYEALEDAGIPIESVKGSRTSVFVGSFTNDYNAMLTKDLTSYPKHTVTGAGNSILANRVSYFYDLQGPSITLDTACSSSLVCFHLGNQSLRHGESDISIVAGSALHFDPAIYCTMTDFGMLSTDGRCRAFDKDGSGYVRGEGVCAMVLKRQSSAESAGDPIRAVVRATGSNHDGLKSGLTLPNGVAQARLIRQTYKDAGLDLADTDYVEAHGTGTKVGDPIESNAIGSVFGPARDTPLYVGSIKSNLGHLEGASGLAGVAKAVMSVSSGKILPNMLFNNPNTAIDFEGLKIKVPTELTDWPGNKAVRRASVNSFGYGGTNAHVILENYRGVQPSPSSVFHKTLLDKLSGETTGRPFILPLSAHNDKASKLNLERIRKFTEDKLDDSFALPDLALSYGHRRSKLQMRSFAIGTDKATILEDLQRPKLWATPVKSAPKLGFVFTGQGAQWHAMGRELLEKSALFRQTIERCDKILSGLPDRPDWTCIEELSKSKEETRLGESKFSQPLCAALQLGIIQVLRAWDISPSAVVGHSSGEIVAAYAAGILSFRNAIICAYYRGLYMSRGTDSSQKGAMIAVGMSEAEGVKLLESYQGRISLAAVNSPSSLTLSGDEDAVIELKAQLDEQGTFNRRLRVEQAFHSHHMIPLAPGFENALSKTTGFEPTPASVRMVSSVTSQDSSARKMDAAYWAANMTGVVRFSDALTGMLVSEDEEQDVDILVEIGPHPALKGPARDVAKSAGVELPYVASLKRDASAFESLLACAGELFSYGYAVDLKAANSDHWLDPVTEQVDVHTPGKVIRELPAYGWDHGNFWAETRVVRQTRQRKSRHTLLGAVVPGSQARWPIWRNYLRLSEIPWLSGHVVQGKVLFPAAGYISMALEAISSVTEVKAGFQLRDITFKNALVLTENEQGTEVILELQPLISSAKNTSSRWYTFSISSFSDDNDTSVVHCRGQIRADLVPEHLPEAVKRSDVIETSKRTDRRKGAELYYNQLQNVGLEYGETFRLLKGHIESGPNFSLAHMDFDPTKVIHFDGDRCIVHPTLLDSAFHTIFAAIETCSGNPLNESFVPTFIRTMVLSDHLVSLKSSDSPQSYYVDCKTNMNGTRVAHNKLRIISEADSTSETQQVLIDMSGLEVTALGNESADADKKRELFFNVAWEPLFSELGSGALPAGINGLPDIVSLFAHEMPDSAILFLDADEKSVENVLNRLGGLSGERRKFSSLNVWSNKDEAAADEIFQSLNQRWSGLLKSAKPESEKYDLIISADASEVDVTEWLKPGGFLVSENAEVASGLTRVFTSGSNSVWRSQNEKELDADVTQPISVIVSPNTSEATKSILSKLIERHAGDVNIITFGSSLPPTSTFISLVSLDKDVLYVPEEEAFQLESLQSLIKCAPRNVVWVTRDALLDAKEPAQAVVHGVIRTIRSENDGIRLATLDFDRKGASSADHVVDRVLQTLFKIPKEDELLERDGVLQVPRIHSDDSRNSKLPIAGNRQVRMTKFREGGRNLALKIGKTGLLDTLAFDDDEDVANPELPDDHIEVEVRASALSFRDIAASIGIIEDHRLGDEAAGYVIRTGKNVSEEEFKIGDRVVVARPGQGCHRTIVRNPASLCLKIGDMDFVTATAFPLALITAYYSLITVGRLEEGEYCLIHSAAGGVGQLAIQVAQRAGAKVIATVGSAEKRAFLTERYGIPDEMIFNSRDDSFLEGVMSVTGGRGCDVALNSLAGELLHATWKSIAPLGRLIEIGKRDIHENSKLDMDPFRRNIVYASVDVITLYTTAPKLLTRLLRKCFTLVESGEIKTPDPMKVFTYGQAQKAFRTLQIGKFFGKIVLTPDDEELVPVAPACFKDRTLFDSQKSYLLVGGLGGIGRSLSEWMYRRGARKIAFLSRSGDNSVEAKDTITWLKERGVETFVFKGDVTSSEVVNACIGELKDTLGGIFQAAMVLRDGPFGQMNADKWSTCVHPKTIGTNNLHQATLGLDLDFFVSFSSMSSVMGSAGQSNYAAANSYIDSLMAHRRGLGLAGTTMNVGVVGEVGAVAEDSAIAVIMDRLGYESISQNELFYQIEEAISASHPARSKSVNGHQIITGINLQRKDLYWASKPLFRNLYANLDLASSGDNQGAKSLLATLKSAGSLDEKIEALTTSFIEKVAAVMGTDPASIQPSQPLTAYGLDSIVAVEFRKWFSSAASLDVPIFDILGAKSIKALIIKAAEPLRSEPDTESIDKAQKEPVAAAR